MTLPEHFQHLYDYHYWANHRILNAAKGLTEEQLHRQQSHSWGSIHGVLLHMMNAEWIWLQRLQGKSPKAFFERKDFPTLMALRKHWDQLERQMRVFVAAQTPQSLERQVTYTSTLGKTACLTAWQIMLHVPNHGTHHRGELAAMFALMDAPHPEEEVVHYALEKSGQRR